LDKGLTFIPTVKRFPLAYITSCRDYNIRACKLRDFFRNSNSEYEPSSFDNLFTAQSTWCPPLSSLAEPTLNAIDSIYQKTSEITRPLVSTHITLGKIVSIPVDSKSDNLTPAERRAISSLTSTRDIIIKPADKGGAVVVMSRDAYRREGLRQLTNPSYYIEIDGPLAAQTIPKINSVVNRLFNSGFITHKQHSFLTAKIPDKPRSFYLLPKVHKPRSKWPYPDMPEGRPIVSDSGSETYNICDFIDFFLKPLATRHESYVKDTYDFISKIKGITIPSNALIVTADVTALYPNMVISRSLEVVKTLFETYPDPRRPDSEILELLDIALNVNDFQFADRFFLQLCGTAMGKTFAPNLANVYMLRFDEAARNGFRIKPLVYFRFLDDIFLVWPGTRDELEEYHTFLNSVIVGITITMCVREQSVEFLDTRVYKLYSLVHSTRPTCSLASSVYFKSTDTHQLLHGKSQHPRHTITGILKSQLIRFKRLSNTKLEFDYAAATLFQVLSKRAYSRTLYRRLKSLVWSSDKYKLTNVRSTNVDKPTRVFPIINYYDKASVNIMRATREAIKELDSLTHAKIVQAYKKHTNLANILTKSCFSDL
jgi:hypothetical protein